jgi:hypothetical protein
MHADLVECAVLWHRSRRGRACYGQHRRITISSTKREHDEAHARERIIAFLKDNPYKDQEAIKVGVDGRWAIVRPVLTTMVKDQSAQKGTGKKGNLFLYYLPDDSTGPRDSAA